MQEVRQRAILDPDNGGMERVSDSTNISKLSNYSVDMFVYTWYLASAARTVSHALQNAKMITPLRLIDLQRQ